MIELSRESFTLLVTAFIISALLMIYYGYHYYYEEMRQQQIIEILVGIVEKGDPNLNGHSLHVFYLCSVIYEFLPYSYKVLIRENDLRYASLLLDIGKLGIPRDILKKSGKLKEEEWDIVKKHPEIGVELLKDVPGFEKIKKYIKYHHERIDGKGYYKLSGRNIPLGARIIAIADTYSAITMNRSYRPSLPYAEAVSELKMAAGTQLDENLVRIFCNIPMNRVDSCLENVRAKIEQYQKEIT